MRNHISTLLFALGTLCIIFGASRIYAADQLQKIAERHSITFPVKELGGCTNLGECRQFCNDPINQPACVAFAKTKGFYKGDIYKQRREAAISSAKNELGCNSEKACKKFCGQSENQEKCSNFAKKYTLHGGVTVDPQKTNIITEAKTTLGCNSPTACTDFCAQEANREKCSSFAKQIGLKGGEVHQGPSGCTSADSCKAFCNDPSHFNECKNFVLPQNTTSTNTFRGPGGCDSESSCKQYCDLHHEECYARMPGGISPTGTQNSPPSSIISPPPGVTSSPSQSTSPISPSSNQLIDCIGPDGKHLQATQQDCDNFNKAWGKAPTSSSGTSGSTSSFSNQNYQNLSTGSQIDCTGPDGHHFQATQAQCDYFNNAWKTSTSQTGTSGSSGGSSGTSGTTSTSGSSGSSGSSGCDSACQQSYCTKTPGCSWSGSTCNCVHSTWASRNLFQLIVDFIFGRIRQ